MKCGAFSSSFDWAGHQDVSRATRGERARKSEQPFGNLLIGCDKRRKHADAIVSRSDEQKLFLVGRLDHLRRRDVRLELQPHQKARTANLFDQARMLVLETLKTLLQMQASCSERASRKPGSEMTSDHRRRDGHPSGLPPNVEPCVPGVMPFAASAVAKNAPTGKPPPKPLAIAMTSGVISRPFVREKLARTAHAGLNFVKHEQQAMLVAKLANGLQEFRRSDAHAPLALDRLEHDRSRLRPDRRLNAFEIAEIDVIETSGGRSETFEILFVARGGERRQRPAMEGAAKSDDPLPLGLARHIMIAARRP